MKQFDTIVRCDKLIQSLSKKIEYFDAKNVLKEIGINVSGKVYDFNALRSALDFLFQNGNFIHKRVIFPAFICPIVPEVARRNNIEPIFIDCSLEDFNIENSGLEQIDFSKVDAIFVNHTFGYPVDITSIRKKIKNVTIIEDAAHAIFSEINGHYVSSYGDFSLISLRKQLPNTGGGLLVTKNDNFDKQFNTLKRAKITLSDLRQIAFFTDAAHQRPIRLLRRLSKLYESAEPKEEKWTIQKSSKISQKLFINGMIKLKEEVEGRRKKAPLYGEYLNDKYFVLQKTRVGKSSYFTINVRLKPDYAYLRDHVVQKLRRQGIFVDRMWYNAAAFLPEFKKYMQGECKKSQLLAKSIINLPIRKDYSEGDIKYLCNELNKSLQELR
ncbi:DegT/DnrJ/EryC1/StrS family aminotransferase [Candidatus Peregrinibacteria bacterium]|nr:DegT/DnrJ/EryC1/StrS family aminotransferase [Candidatus Peregrinibacteria bacterium]